MSSKIRIKVGEMEVEYEGTEEFLKKELPGLLKTVSLLYQPTQNLGGGGSSFTTPNIQLSTANIAAKLGAESGPDVVLSACAHLSFAQRKDTYDRKSILSEMKKAKGFYKSSYGANLTGYLQGLIKSGDLIQNASNSYSLHANKAKDLSTRLAQ